MYKKVLIKLSGEALAGSKGHGFDIDTVTRVVKEIKQVLDKGIQVAIVIGGGNFWRGRTDPNMDRVKSDQIGMLATVMNVLYMAEICSMNGIESEVLTPFPMGNFTKQFSKELASEYLDSGKLVFFAGGTGHPFFSTDTAAALRGAEIGVNALLFAKNIDGVYDSDPKQNVDANKFDSITYRELVSKNLKVIDLTASTLCMEFNLPTVIFDLNVSDNILKAINEEKVGTIINI